jgi:hypothetical protein
MRVPLAVLGLLAACGSVPTRNPSDASGPSPDAPRDAAADASPDAPPCTAFVASTSTATDVLSFTFTGGAFASYGCAPIDPNYWMSGSGMSATVTFVAPQSHPSIRVWGMNTDDTASIKVNGNAYTLDATSASLAPKVVCGVSPGPDGMAFANGLLAGANMPADGNYSYQDVTINQTGVTSIQISGLTGAGWGFAGASAACATPQM